MKIRVDGESLNAAASWAAKIAPANPAPPVLGGMLLDAGEHLSLAATDFDLFGSVTLAADAVFDEGRAVVSARLLAAVTKLLGRSDEVELITDDSSLTIKRGRARWSMPLMAIEEYPAAPELAGEIGRIPAEDLKAALGRVLPAVAVETKTEALSAMTGVLVNAGESLTLVGTDRYRLAVMEASWQRALTTGDATYLVPANLLQAVLGTLNGSQVSLHGDEGLFGIRSGCHQVTGRLLAARFPPWQQVLLAAKPNVATVDTADMLAAIKGVGVFSDRFEPIELAFAEGNVHVASHNLHQAGVGSDDDVELRSFAGEPIAIWCRPAYLVDALSCIGQPTTEITFGKPILLRGLGEDGPVESYRHALMPLTTPLARAVSPA